MHGVETVHREPQSWWFEPELLHVSCRSVPEQDTQRQDNYRELSVCVK